MQVSLDPLIDQQRRILAAFTIVSATQSQVLNPVARWHGDQRMEPSIHDGAVMKMSIFRKISAAMTVSMSPVISAVICCRNAVTRFRAHPPASHRLLR